MVFKWDYNIATNNFTLKLQNKTYFGFCLLYRFWYQSPNFIAISLINVLSEVNYKLFQKK